MFPNTKYLDNCKIDCSPDSIPFHLRMVAQWNVIYEHILNSRHSTRLIMVCSLHTNNIIDHPHTKVFFHEWQYDQNMVIHKNGQQCQNFSICKLCNAIEITKKFESLLYLDIVRHWKSIFQKFNIF